MLSALCIVTIDQPLARWIATYEPSKLWDRGIEVLEYAIGLPWFKIASSVALAAAMIAVLAVKRWRRYAPALMLIAGTHIFSRFLTVRIKEATGRLRPGEWLKQGGDDTFLWEQGIAFPSGHVVLFASILIPLAVVAPRTRPLLAIVAFAMIARLAVDAHFVSDVLGGVTLASLVTWAVGWAVRPLPPRT